MWPVMNVICLTVHGTEVQLHFVCKLIQLFAAVVYGYSSAINSFLAASVSFPLTIITSVKGLYPMLCKSAEFSYVKDITTFL